VKFELSFNVRCLPLICFVSIYSLSISSEKDCSPAWSSMGMTELSLFDPLLIFDPQEITTGTLYPTGGCLLVSDTGLDTYFLNITFWDCDDPDYPRLPRLILELCWITEMRSKDFLLFFGSTIISSPHSPSPPPQPPTSQNPLFFPSSQCWNFSPCQCCSN
jgi:hypothetical protein